MPIKGTEGDTETVWMNPDSVVTMRLLKDGRYVVYRVDNPREQLVMDNLNEAKKVSEMFHRAGIVHSCCEDVHVLALQGLLQIRELDKTAADWQAKYESALVQIDALKVRLSQQGVQ